MFVISVNGHDKFATFATFATQYTLISVIRSDEFYHVKAIGPISEVSE